MACLKATPLHHKSVFVNAPGMQVVERGISLLFLLR